MKILLVHTNYQNIGGEDIAVKNEANFLKQEHNVEELYFSNHISKNPIAILKQLVYFLSNKNKDSLNLIEKKIKTFKPDLVYIHNTWFKISLGIFDLTKKYNLKTFVKIHNFRHYCTQSYLSKKHLRGQQICNACGFEKKNFQFLNKYFEASYLKSFFVILYGKAYSKILKEKDIKILTLSNFQKEFLMKENIDKKKIVIFPNYTNVDIEVDESKESDFEAKGIVYAGRISKEKGLVELIEAYNSANLNKMPLHIIGEGPLLKFLKKNYVNKDIIFHGELDHKKVLTIISKSTAVVTVTKLYEGQPTLLCEASGLGIPSVFPNTGGIFEFFPKDYPLSFKQFDHLDLISKIKMVADPNLINELSVRVKDNIDLEFSDTTLLNKFSNIF